MLSTADFETGSYLREYYDTMGPENLFLLRFFHDTWAKIPEGARLLEFGGGPTIYQLLSAANRVSSVTFAEYAAPNRDEVERWIRGQPEAFDWNAFTRVVLDLEGAASDHDAILDREDKVREAIRQVIPCDALAQDALVGRGKGPYDVVSAIFVVEGVSDEQPLAEKAMQTVLALVDPGKWLVMCCVTGCHFYMAGGQKLPAWAYTPEEVKEIVQKAGLEVLDFRFETAEPGRAYTGMCAVFARRPEKA